MPRFYDEENPALNSFRKVNAEVVKRRKTKYKTKEPIAPSVSGTPEIFDNLRQRLVAIDVGLNELSETIRLSESARSPSTVIDRFVSLSSNLSGQVSNTRDFVVRKLKRNLNSLTSEEVAEIGTIVQSLSQKLDKSVSILQDRISTATSRARELFSERTLDVLQDFTSGLQELLQILGDSVASYRQSGVGAGRRGGKYTTLPIRNRTPIGLANPVYILPDMPDARYFRKIGGAELYSQEPVLKGGSPASYRVGLDKSANPYTHLGRLAPRNTHDLRDLPRRFL